MIIVLLTDGFEEIEALTPVDMIRRAGLEVKTVGVNSKIAVGSHGIPVVCDITADEVKLSDVSMAVLPGGMPGTLNLDASPFTSKVISSVLSRGGRVAAICAAPLILGKRGLLDGRRATCFPGFENELLGATCTGEAVVTDGEITTARGMDVALEFANELVRLLTNPTDEACNYEADIDFEALGLGDLDDETKLEIQDTATSVTQTLKSFNAPVSISAIQRGPRVTGYDVIPSPGVRVSDIIALEDDLPLAFATNGIRISLPTPGKSTVGIEIPNKKSSPVTLKELLEAEEFKGAKSKTTVCIGKDISGNPVISDLAKMPHLLIAGATGMGKSVCINSLLVSMLSKANPDELKLIMIDPKQIEFTMYNDIPHLLTPVITSAKKAVEALTWAVNEMERRYQLLTPLLVRNIDGYNEKIANSPDLGEPLPKIVIVIDELADLMLSARDSVEHLIMRIAQKARAVGIHMIIGTQDISDEVITDVIKANIPTRISCKVASSANSVSILDTAGAEKLLDKGDMLYAFAGAVKPVRVQGAFISDAELERFTSELKPSAFSF